LDLTRPLVLDFDHAVGPFTDENRIDLFDWQERIRFGCGLSTFSQLSEYLDHQLPEAYGTVFMGSGDYHHVTLALLERLEVSIPKLIPLRWLFLIIIQIICVFLLACIAVLGSSMSQSCPLFSMSM